jgi:hypothetical protein
MLSPFAARMARNSQRATARLSEYLVNGFDMETSGLQSQLGAGVPDYFDELWYHFRDANASRRFDWLACHRFGLGGSISTRRNAISNAII